MRKFLTVLMAVLMLAAALAVLPVAAAEVQSSKDGSTAADANAMDLVITEVLADTQANNVAMKSKNAFQYIEIYNRGAVAVNLYDYAIVRAAYNEKHPGQEWDSKKFDKKLVLDSGSIYAYYVENNVPNINLYNTSVFECNNPNDGTLNPGEVAIIWVWNADTKDVFGSNGGTTASEKNGTFNTFRNHYADMGAPIPAGTKVFATFGVDGIGQSCQLNTSKNYMYALVDDSGDDFDVATEVAYSMSVGGYYTRNPKVKTMWMYGTGLGMYTTTENQSAVYTLASKTPYLTNAMYDKTDSDYYTSGAVDSFKEMACISYEEGMTPGTLLPVQYADMDPTNAKAPADGAAAWKAYLDAHIDNTEITNRPEEDKNQSDIDVNRADLGNQGQNKLGEWTYYEKVDEATGEVTYWRYKTEGGSKEESVEATKEEYELYLKALAESEEEEGLGIWLWVIIGGAAVVVLGGAAVVLIIVLKKKNKNVAEDDVPVGFVPVYDDGAAQQYAPAPAPEANDQQQPPMQ